MSRTVNIAFVRLSLYSGEAATYLGVVRESDIHHALGFSSLIPLRNVATELRTLWCPKEKRTFCLKFRSVGIALMFTDEVQKRNLKYHITADFLFQEYAVPSFNHAPLVSHVVTMSCFLWDLRRVYCIQIPFKCYAVITQC